MVWERLFVLVVSFASLDWPQGRLCIYVDIDNPVFSNELFYMSDSRDVCSAGLKFDISPTPITMRNDRGRRFTVIFLQRLHRRATSM